MVSVLPRTRTSRPCHLGALIATFFPAGPVEFALSHTIMASSSPSHSRYLRHSCLPSYLPIEVPLHGQNNGAVAQFHVPMNTWNRLAATGKVLLLSPHQVNINPFSQADFESNSKTFQDTSTLSHHTFTTRKQLPRPRSLGAPSPIPLLSRAFALFHPQSWAGERSWQFKRTNRDFYPAGKREPRGGSRRLPTFIFRPPSPGRTALLGHAELKIRYGMR